MEDSLRDEKSDAEGIKLTYNNNRMWMQLANVALAAFSSRGNKLSEEWTEWSYGDGSVCRPVSHIKRG